MANSSLQRGSPSNSYDLILCQWGLYTVIPVMSLVRLIQYVPQGRRADCSPAASPNSPPNNPPADATGHGFFVLPGEIRNKIYRYLLGPNSNILGNYEDARRTKVLFERESFIRLFMRRRNDHGSSESPRKTVAYRYKSSFLSVSRRIYTKASRIFYEENEFICFRSSSATSRVLEECGFMKVSSNLIHDKWTACFRLKWQINSRDRFVYMIPSVELWILARIFLRINTSRTVAFAYSALRLILYQSIQTISDVLADRIMQPIDELYNVRRMTLDIRLRRYLLPQGHIALIDHFKWERFLVQTMDDMRKSHHFYFAGDLESALMWNTSTIEDLDGCRETHYASWERRGNQLKTKSSFIRQDLHIWSYKLSIEVAPAEGPITDRDNNTERRVRNCGELDQVSLLIVWLAWHATVSLGLGRYQEALTKHDEICGLVWAGGPELA